MTRAALVFLAASVASACGGRTPNPSGPSTPTLPQIGGTYAGPTTDNSTSPPQQILLWTIKSKREGAGGFSFRSCTGTLVIQQTGSSFTGSFTQGATCASSTGLVTTGVVQADGAVTFSVAGPASDPLAWTNFARCTTVVPGTMDFTGTVTAGLLDASFAHDALIECPNEGFVTVNVRLRGTR
jgi:hypothetical protein